MVEERISVEWRDFSVHRPPSKGKSKGETEIPAEDLIEALPGWDVIKHSHFYTCLRKLTEEEDSYVSSSYGVHIGCKGEYGKNMRQLRDAKNAVLKLAELSNRGSNWLEDKECEARITCDSLPSEITHDPNKALSQLLNTLRRSELSKSESKSESRPLRATLEGVSYELGLKLLEVNMVSLYPAFENYYREKFSKMFVFR